MLLYWLNIVCVCVCVAWYISCLFFHSHFFLHFFSDSIITIIDFFHLFNKPLIIFPSPPLLLSLPLYFSTVGHLLYVTFSTRTFLASPLYLVNSYSSFSPDHPSWSYWLPSQHFVATDLLLHIIYHTVLQLPIFFCVSPTTA